MAACRLALFLVLPFCAFAQSSFEGLLQDATRAEKALRFGEAETVYRQALQAVEGAGPDESVALVVFRLADLYRRLGRYTEAEPLLQRALVLREARLSAETADVAAVLVNLAMLKSAQGKYAEAEAPARRAQAIYEKLGMKTLEAAQALGTLGWIERLKENLPEAEESLGQAVEITDKLRGPHEAIGATEMNNLALFYKAQGRTVRAEQLLRHVLEIRIRVQGPAHPDVAIALNNIASLLSQRLQVDEAEKLLKRALKIFEKSLGAENIQVGNTLNSLAMNYLAKNEPKQAEPRARRALAIFEQAYGPNHPQVASMLENYAGVLEHLGRKGEAAGLQSRAKAILSSVAKLTP